MDFVKTVIAIVKICTIIFMLPPEVKLQLSNDEIQKNGQALETLMAREREGSRREKERE